MLPTGEPIPPPAVASGRWKAIVAVLLVTIVVLAALLVQARSRNSQFREAYLDLDREYRILSTRYLLKVDLSNAVYHHDFESLQAAIQDFDWTSATSSDQKSAVDAVLYFLQRSEDSYVAPRTDQGGHIADGKALTDFPPIENFYDFMVHWKFQRLREGLSASPNVADDAISFFGQEDVALPDNLESFFSFFEDLHSLRVAYPDLDLSNINLQEDPIPEIISDRVFSRAFFVYHFVTGRCEFLTSLRKHVVEHPTDFPNNLNRVIGFEYACHRRHRPEAELEALLPVFEALGHNPETVYNSIVHRSGDRGFPALP